MRKNIVVLSGSPRRNGNTEALSGAFVRGAEEGGNSVTSFDVCRMDIKACTGCQKCFVERKCVFDDDMNMIYDALSRADVLVFASPIFWFGLNGQLKTAIDRFSGCDISKFPIKSAVLLMTMASTDMETAEPSVSNFKGICSYLGWEAKAVIIQGGTDKIGDIEGKPSLIEAENLGKSI